MRERVKRECITNHERLEVDNWGKIARISTSDVRCPMLSQAKLLVNQQKSAFDSTNLRSKTVALGEIYDQTVTWASSK